MAKPQISKVLRRLLAGSFPSSEKGQLRAAGLAGSLLRAADAATGNGMLLRTSGNRTLRTASEILGSASADMLKGPGAVKALKAMDPDTRSRVMKLLAVSALNPTTPGLDDAAARYANNSVKDALASMRKGTPIKEQVDTGSMPLQERAKLLTGYMKTLDTADRKSHGTFSNPTDVAMYEMSSVVPDKSAGRSYPEADLFKFDIGDSKSVYATGRNINGLAYIEELAAGGLRDRLKAMQTMAKSDTPIATVVMADIGDMMVRKSDSGWHLIATTDGYWGDTFHNAVNVPKYVVVNDAAYRQNVGNRAIAFHQAVYHPSFMNRTREQPKDVIDAMQKYTTDMLAYRDSYARNVRGGSRYTRLMGERSRMAEDLYNAVESGKWADGRPFTEETFEAATDALAKQDAAIDRSLGRMDAARAWSDAYAASAMLKGTPQSEIDNFNRLRRSQAPWIPLSAPDYDSRAPEMNKGNITPDGGIRINKDWLDRRPWFGTPGQGMDKQSAFRLPRGFSWALGAMKRTGGNALNMYRTSPWQASKLTARRVMFDLPVQTLSMLDTPKALFSNKALWDRLNQDPTASASYKRKLIRDIRMNQLAGTGLAAGTAAGAAGLYGLTSGTDAGKPLASSSTAAPVLPDSQKVPEAPKATGAVPAAPAAPAAPASPAAAPGDKAQDMWGQFTDWAEKNKTGLAVAGGGLALLALLMLAMQGRR